jgi:hypothetical protein
MLSSTVYNLNEKRNLIMYGTLCAFAVSQIKHKVIPVRKHRVLKTHRGQIKHPVSESAVFSRFSKGLITVQNVIKTG